MQIKHIGLVSVPVKDQDVAKSFYVDVLGFNVIMDGPFNRGARWIMLTPKGAETAITLVTWFPQMAPGSCQGLLFEVDDVVAAHAELAARGVKVNALDNAPWGAYFTFNDPDGNGLVMRQSPGRGG